MALNALKDALTAHGNFWEFEQDYINYALFQGLYLFPLYINIGICSSHLILVSSLYIREITIKFQRKCFKGKVVRVHGFRWKFKVIYKDSQHKIDSVRDRDGYTEVL